MEFLVHQGKKENQVYWEHFQAQKENLAFQEPKETRESLDFQVSLAGKEQWEILGHQDPQAWQDPKDPQVYLV